MGRPAVVRTLTVQIDGVAHHGAYFVQNSIVYLQSVLGSKATHVGGSPPEIRPSCSRLNSFAAELRKPSEIRIALG